ncbi:DICT sensory domain-containing protein [Actinoplanes sp. DH11]|uniref:DICT sensory domain-containing protein n=1 Tax=Actinoplanes sp. DH11 TaxID=2857011 RepID=UPI001E2C05B3|nr:DICT sensory domain-containing protein [Actinoplanes sp. DH11]
MSNTPDRRTFTKRTLVTLSHALERTALAAAEDGPMVVLALFQRAPYFARERQVYDRIAVRAAATVVCMVADEPPAAGTGTHVVLLHPDEEAAREWTVVVLTPRFGAVLNAYDREQVDGSAATLEAGRLFDGWWSLRRDDALHEVLRLRSMLGDRLAPDALAALDGAVAYVRDLPAGTGERRADAAVRFLLEQVERDSARLARRQAAAADRPVVSGPAEVGRWSGSGGVTASGTLPVALLGVRVPAAQQLPEQTGRRAGMLRNEGLLGVLGPLLRDADRMTRLDDDTFLLMLPALSADDAVKLAHRVGADLLAASARDTFTPATAHTVVTVTRQRPFPVDHIRQALSWAERQGIPVATLNGD